MARPLRIHRPYAFYHVMARGNNKEPVFLDGDDRRFALARAAKLSRRLRVELHAFCLMTNHLHLLLRIADIPVSRFMELWLGGYAQRFNTKHERVGHVFQGRFRAKVVVHERYLHEVGRYIHMNPVKAGLVSMPEEYPWSSLTEYRRRECVPWLERATLMAPFGGDLAEFYEFTVARQGVFADPRGWPKDCGWYLEPEGEEPAPAALRWDETPKPVNCEVVFSRVASAFGVESRDIRSGWRNRLLGDARAAVMLILREQTDLNLRAIGAEMGLRTPQGVAIAIRCLRDRMKDDPCLLRRLSKAGMGAPGLEDKASLSSL